MTLKLLNIVIFGCDILILTKPFFLEKRLKCI